MECTIGVDLGGTRIKAVAVKENGEVLHQLYLPTNDGNDAVWKNAVARAVQDLQDLLALRGCRVGISAPGLPNDTNTAIAYMPGRMQGLEDFDWSGLLKRETLVLNDAVAALLAEARWGAACNRRNVVMLTLGTGVGGAILINGKPYQGSFNKAGHMGHMVIDHMGEKDVTGMPGSLEECIGNCTVEKRSGGKFSSTADLIAAYRAGDGQAKDIWLKSVRQLAIGLASLDNILSPDMIVLGGGITQAEDDLFGPLRDFMREYEWCPGGNRVEIVKAFYGDMAGAIGAAGYAMEN